jgi:Fe-S cluster assembly iron-binding protein IscA
MDIGKKSIKSNFMNTSPNLSSLNTYGLNINFKKQHTSKSESSDTSQDTNITVLSTPKNNTIDIDENIHCLNNENKSTESVTENNSAEAVVENKSVEAVVENNSAEAVVENKSVEAVIENKSVEAVTETKMTFIDLLTNLKLFSHIKAYDKLTINNNIIDIDNYYFRDLFRRIRGESHLDTLNFIELMLNYAEEYSNEFIKNKSMDDNHKLKLLTEDLDNCKIGLNNLKITYAHYNIVICKIDIYIEQINTRINKNKI